MSELLKRVAEVFNAEETNLRRLEPSATTPEWINLAARLDQITSLRAVILDLIREDLKNED
jgi:hypothetical protein